jgi:hypothetical protein
MSKKRKMSSSSENEEQRTSSTEQPEFNDEVISPSETKKKKPIPGVLYLSRIPNKMNVTIIRSYFDQYGETKRIYLQLSSKFLFFFNSNLIFFLKKMKIKINENVLRSTAKVGLNLNLNVMQN